MLFNKTPLEGAYIVDLQKIEDTRGFFARTWCANELKCQGLETRMAQCNLSYNEKKGTLRGMHYQIAPHAETKFVRCLRGAIYDVIIDLNRHSPTYLRWAGFELSEMNRKALYIPKMFAHGYLTMDDATEVFYQASEFHSPPHEKGIRWSDPMFGIQWPELCELIISEKDQSWPDFGL